jgi:predicted RNase H-like nuclease (RuvC/YqgF family)
MDKNRFETQKEVVNLDPTVHNIQSFFSVEDLKWLIEQAEKVKRLESVADELQNELIEKDEKIEQLKGELVDKDKTIRAWRKR